MMADVYVLNKNLRPIGIADGYKSLIWSNRYNELGDCEIYTQATTENFEMFAIGNYLYRLDDDMVCQIKRIELDTSVEEGNYIIVTGYDAKALLEQRIIWGTMTCNGNVEDFVRSMILESIINADARRKMTKPDGTDLFVLGDKANFTEDNMEQVSYANVGEKIREICKQYQWGYRVGLNEGQLVFNLYKGEDKSDWVVFSPDYENLATTKYVTDNTNMGNVALVAGEGEGSERVKETIGTSRNLDRYEIYVDARDLSKRINYDTLVNSYPGGSIVQVGDDYFYQMASFDIQIFNNQQLVDLETAYPDGQVIDDKWYRVYNINIASVPFDDPSSNNDCILADVIYQTYLLSRGYDKLSGYGTSVTFEGVVEPYITFEYKKDYFLGDVVTVRNEYGITLEARITEIVEVNDDNGYSIEPKFEYIEVSQED